MDVERGLGLVDSAAARIRKNKSYQDGDHQSGQRGTKINRG